MTSDKVRLSEIIGPAFFDLHKAVKSGTVTEVVTEGGRGSLKSSWCSIETILWLEKHPDSHAVVMRQVATTLRTSVYAQMLWAIDILGLKDRYRGIGNPLEITNKVTGQKIYFFGADDPGKMKSLKTPTGYIGLLWIEELDQFKGPEAVRTIEQSFRGGKNMLVLKSYNPPAMRRSWVNVYAAEEKPGKLVHHSTYLDVPPEWLGEKWLGDAEHLKNKNPQAYAHEYLGEIVGSGTEVFTNIEKRQITEEEREQFDRIYRGVDWGFYPDPWTYNAMHFDAARRTLYIFDELHYNRQNNQYTAQRIKERGVGPNDLITADSAEPKSVDDYRTMGLFCRSVIKGPGSVEYSMKWLQGLDAIIIDPDTCPYTAKEFDEYEFARAADGAVIDRYPDVDNHHIDAVRYGMSPVWRSRGELRE